jgi:hypothetical protein
MTPLARLIVQHKLHPTPKNTILPAVDGSAKLSDRDSEFLLHLATSAHCFDVTDVYREGLIELVADKMQEGWHQDSRFDRTLAFLPSRGSNVRSRRHTVTTP